MPDEKPKKTYSPTVKKKSFFNRLKSDLIETDGETVKEYLFREVLLPNMKDAASTVVRSITDTISGTIDMFLFGSDSRKRRSNKSSDRFGGAYNYVNYSMYSSPKASTASRRDYGRESTWDTEFSFRTEAEAQELLDSLQDILDHYGLVSVGDLNELVSASFRYPMMDYGWTSLKNARIERGRGGREWILSLPKPMPIR